MIYAVDGRRKRKSGGECKIIQKLSEDAGQKDYASCGAAWEGK